MWEFCGVVNSKKIMVYSKWIFIEKCLCRFWNNGVWFRVIWFRGWRKSSFCWLVIKGMFFEGGEKEENC